MPRKQQLFYSTQNVSSTSEWTCALLEVCVHSALFENNLYLSITLCRKVLFHRRILLFHRRIPLYLKNCAPQNFYVVRKLWCDFHVVQDAYLHFFQNVIIWHTSLATLSARLSGTYSMLMASMKSIQTVQITTLSGLELISNHLHYAVFQNFRKSTIFQGEFC